MMSSRWYPSSSNGVKEKETKHEDRKVRPNYFVGMQVDNPQIRDALEEVQARILQCKPNMKAALISLSTLHITFIVLRIDQKEDLQRASDALTASYNQVKEDLKGSPLYLTFQNISHFNKKVLFAEICMDENWKKLIKVYETIVACFENYGFDLEERTSFTPHLTIAKLSKDRRLQKKGIKVISPAWYEDFIDNVFGVQLLKSLQLLRMDGAKDDHGYYQCHKECHFDLPANDGNKSSQTLCSVFEDKKKIREKIRDLTVDKLNH